MSKGAYLRSQLAMAQLKGAIYELLLSVGDAGLKNVDIGRALGIYAGHARHEGHISRSLLAAMERDGVVEQDADSKVWRVRKSVAPVANGEL